MSQSPLPPPRVNPDDRDPAEEADGPLDRFFQDPRWRRVGRVLSLGLLFLIPIGGILASRVVPPPQNGGLPPVMIERPKDPAALEAYERELRVLQAEGLRMKKSGTSRDEIARQLDPRLRDLNDRYRGK